MSNALELRAISKRFVVGTGQCRGVVHALSSVDLDVRSGESVAIVGRRGAGKSTLLLCAAGLLRVDEGVVAWFGSRERGAAALRAMYYFPGAPARVSERENDAARIHLVDESDFHASVPSLRFERWIHRRCADGDAVLFATTDELVAHSLATRTVILAQGRVLRESHQRGSARVAEPIEWGHR